MTDETQVQQLDEVAPEDGASVEPVDLNEAFKLLRDTDTKAPETDVADGEQETGQQPEAALELPTSIDSDDSGGGPATGDTDGELLPPTAAREAIAQLLRNVNTQAASAANEKFKERGIRKATTKDLAQKDERSGRISFKNPDDPDNPFRSRAEAQAWVDSFNKDVDDEWQVTAKGYQQQYLDNAKPAIRLLEFAPTFEKLDRVRQQMFNDIIEPYEIRVNGQLIGYSCDLDSALGVVNKQMTNLAAMAPRKVVPKTSEGSVEVKKASSAPALDMKSSKMSQTDDKEPTTLQEAMAMYNRQQKAERK